MIREVTENDKKIYMELTKEFYASDGVSGKIPDSYFEQTFSEIIGESKYAKAFLLEYEAMPVGYALIAITYSNESGGINIWIEEIYVRKAFRSKGLGSEFIQYIEDAYKECATRLRLEVREDNIKAINLYKELGFVKSEYVQMYKYINKNCE